MDKNQAQALLVDDSLIGALEAVLDHLWSEEFEDYHSIDPDHPIRANHIFLHLEVIRAWLDHVEEDCGRG